MEKSGIKSKRIVVPKVTDCNHAYSFENNGNQCIIKRKRNNFQKTLKPIKNNKIHKLKKEESIDCYENNEENEVNENIDYIKSIIKSIIQNLPENAALFFKDIQLDGISLTLQESIDIISLFKNSELCQKTKELYDKSYFSKETKYANELSRLEDEVEYAKNYMEEHDLPYFPPVKEKPDDFEPDIHKACIEGKLTSVQYLIEKMNVDKNKMNIYGTASIHIACLYCHLPIIRYLIEIQGVDKEFPSEKGTTPFQHLCGNEVEENALPIVSYFANKLKVDINAVNDDGNNALIFACFCGKIDIVTYLIENLHCDLNIVNNDGEDFVLASCAGNLHLLKYVLTKKEVNLSKLATKTGRCAIHNAAISKDKSLIKYFIEDLKFDKHIVNEDGYDVLHYACCRENLDNVKYLIEEQGFDINKPDVDGESPIYRAIENGCFLIVKYLLGLPNIDKTIKNKNGSSMLHHACRYGTLEIIKYLIEVEKMDFHATNNEGETIFMCACYNKYAQKGIFQYLYSLNHDFIIRKDCYGLTPIYFTCILGCINGLEFLLDDCHIDFKKVTPFKNFDPVVYAICYQNINILQYLLERHIINKNYRESFCGYTLLQIACEVNHINVVKWLVEKVKVNINQITENKTALDIAIGHGFDEITDYLRSIGAISYEEVNK